LDGISSELINPPNQSLIAVVTGKPAFLLVAAYNRTSPDAIATILGATIGYALGKVG
jgi:hypothetical protein